MPNQPAITLPRVNSNGYTLGEEIANTITSGVGTALSVAGLVVLIVSVAPGASPRHIVGVVIFGACLIASHLASTLYHGIAPPAAKRVLKKFDHLAIYLLIAGTYTPFTLVNLHGPWGWGLLTLVWTLAGVGGVVKFTRLDHVRYLSTGFYLTMGWAVLLVVKPLIDHVAPGGLWLLLAGGLCYTVGVAFYAWHSLAYNHSVWHLFVLGGSIFHFFAVLLYVIAPAAAS